MLSTGLTGLSRQLFLVATQAQSELGAARKEERQIVQFCPCGHTAWKTTEEIRELGGSHQLEDIERGIKLDAPIFSSEDCPMCQADREENERRWELDFGDGNKK